MHCTVTGDRIQDSLQAKVAALQQRLARVGTNSEGKLPCPMMVVGNALIGVQLQTIALMLEIQELQVMCLNINIIYRFG